MNGTIDVCDLLANDSSNPLGQEDCDGDGVINITECEDGTDPTDLCDYLLNSQTVDPSQEWLDTDCDGDGVTNEDEVDDGTDPQDPCDFDVSSQTIDPSEEWNELDCDGDGVNNDQEIEDDTDPTDLCDFDWENLDLSTVSQEWLDADCDCEGDGDGIPNGEEISDDNDNGIPDYMECNNGDISAEDDLEVFDIMTPNDDGLNDVLVIRGIQNYPVNTLEIYNRWGVKVYGVEGYGVNSNFFKGISDGRTTISRGEQLPIGTYYYILVYVNNEGVTKRLAGPLYINLK